MSNTYTPNIAIATPAFNDPGWDVPLRNNATLLDSQTAIGGGGVAFTEQPSATLNVKVGALVFRNSQGQLVTYAGVSSVAMTTSATNYLYLTDAGALVVNTSGFPANTYHIRIATVVAGSGTITSIADARVQLGSSGADPLVTTGTVSTISAGAGAGTGPTVSVTGTPHAGQITVTTGSAPTASATVATVTFASAFAATPQTVLLIPANANAAALTGNGAVYCDVANLTTAHFLLSVGSSALAATTTYKWYFIILG